MLGDGVEVKGCGFSRWKDTGMKLWNWAMETLVVELTGLIFCFNIIYQYCQVFPSFHIQHLSAPVSYLVHHDFGHYLDASIISHSFDLFTHIIMAWRKEVRLCLLMFN